MKLCGQFQNCYGFKGSSMIYMSLVSALIWIWDQLQHRIWVQDQFQRQHEIIISLVNDIRQDQFMKRCGLRNSSRNGMKLGSVPESVSVRSVTVPEPIGIQSQFLDLNMFSDWYGHWISSKSCMRSGSTLGLLWIWDQLHDRYGCIISSRTNACSELVTATVLDRIYFNISMGTGPVPAPIWVKHQSQDPYESSQSFKINMGSGTEQEPM